MLGPHIFGASPVISCINSTSWRESGQLLRILDTVEERPDAEPELVSSSEL